MLQEQLDKLIQNNFATNLQGLLVLELSPNQLSICIIDQLSGEIKVCSKTELSNKNIENYIQSLETILSHNALNKSFKKVSVLVNTEKTMLIPEALFNSENKEDTIKDILNKDINDLLIHSSVKGVGTVCAFYFNKNVYALLIRKFPNVKIKSIQEKALELSTQINSETFLFAYCNTEKLHIVVKQHRNLLLSNCYSIKTNEDAAYYIYFVLEQLKMSQENTKLILSGTFANTNALVDLLKRYSRLVELHVNTNSNYTAFDSTELKPEERVHLINEV